MLKRPLDEDDSYFEATKRQAGVSLGGNQFTMKMLLSCEEAGCVNGQGGSALENLQLQTETLFRLSGEEMPYPGTDLQELSICGSNVDLVVNAAAFCFAHIAETLGVVAGGETGVAPADCRVKLIVPCRSVKAIIGPAGQSISQIRQQSGLHVHVDREVVPPGPPSDVSEQIVCLSGAINGLQNALGLIGAILAQSGAEPWFAAWAEQTYCGQSFPGLKLFVESGKGLGKGKSDKDTPRSKGPTMSPSQQVCIKLLVSQTEATSILGKGGATIREIAQSSNCKMTLSGRERFYPGTNNLQELKVLGHSDSEVANAAMGALNHISTTSNERNVPCGEFGVPPGHARVRIVVPYLAAKAVIGKGGENIQQIRYQSELFVHVEPEMIPPGAPGPATEQVVCLSGPLQGVPVAVQFVVAQVSTFRQEAWFPQWANSSYAGTVIPGFRLLLENKKGKGGGKGHQGKAWVPEPVMHQPQNGPRVVRPQEKRFSDATDKSALVAKLSDQVAAKKAAAEKAMADAVAAEQALQDATSGNVEADEIYQQLLSEGQEWLETNGEGSAEHAYGGPNASAAAPSTANGSLIAMKLLLPPHEATCLLGDDGSRLSELQSMSGTNMRLSEGLYPGSSLHEVTIQGVTSEAVLVAIVQIMTVVEETLGTVTSGEAVVEPGGSRLKLVMPSKAAAAIIGVGGATVKQIRQQCQVRVSVDMNTVPCAAGVFEQAVLLSGAGAGLQQALPIILEQVGQLAAERGLDSWAAHSNAGVEIPGFVLFAPKGEGKGKSKKQSAPAIL